ncbi:transcriptional regulator [Yinghuangia sp. ASG 101]|uniref:transcriptional regulator n=1 Tax=Yinghuangia sp. ASG 101 TaxID=2896848 RepID=UPI001E2F6471|nr:transcriptional regulator [Yinghuangia sp. ASG 101]UGQ10978.1 transcriptional regulator [Yinghuangia sp. ASG 101]
MSEAGGSGAAMGRTPNDQLAALIDEAGCSHGALARDITTLAAERGLDVRCDHIDVGRWRAGMRPRGVKPQLVAEALGRRVNRPLTLGDVGMEGRGGPSLNLALSFAEDRTTVLRTATTLWDEDLKRSDFLRRGAVTAAMLATPMTDWLLASPADPAYRTGRMPRVGVAEVDAVRATARMFEDLDHQYGGGHARTAAVQYLHAHVSPLLRGTYTDAVGRDLFAVAAQFVYKTGAMAYDTGLHGLARRYFVQGLGLAHASGDRALGGKVLALMSHQANFLGEYRDALQFARAAKLGASGHATPRVHAMYCAMEARALASLGDTRACLRALREAETAFAKGMDGDDPSWIGYFDAAELHDEAGHCFTALRQRADVEYRARLALGDVSDAYPRSRTFCRLSLATAQLRARDVEQACATATTAMSAMRQIKSARVRAYLRSFAAETRPYADVPAVKDFHHQARELFEAA